MTRILKGTPAGTGKSGLGDRIARKFRRYFVPDSHIVARQYRERTNRRLDLSAPRDLSEKVQWLKLHDRSPLHSRCADKIRAREYVAAQVGSDVLTQAHLVTYDLAEVRPDRISPERFVIKTNHDQGGVFICRNRAEFDWDAVRTEIAARMAKNKYMAFREYQYKSIRPGVLVEEYLEAPHGGNVREIKFYCFHGEPRFIQVVNDRFHGKREAFYDPDWNLMPFWGPVPLIEERLPRPGGLYAMREQARALSRPFLFCRIDFLHDTVDRHWFGEITFHHGAGLVRFEPPEFERRFGDYIDLSRLDETRRLQRALA